ncbi:MAG: Gfo/Idh/MocA family oxidoreductase [Candidatus Omnitrophica bacterium]|nr:Gfo/Idh/MocA family oxidoreductase [Candidatus Omnitrophota bacterium]
MKLKIAVAGFRHGHIYALYHLAKGRNDIEIVAACEEDESAREDVIRSKVATLTHSNFEEMLKTVDCQVIALGDYYGRRGILAIRALETGRHVLSDKPLCTSLEELNQIEHLSQAGNLKVGCMFSLRGSPPFLTAREIIRQGLIGEIQAISFGGQHPLSLGTRPWWYFEPGKHGGTINDLAVHAIDALPWMTGYQFALVNAARVWNAFVPQYPHFQDGAQMMLTMDNGCGVLGDVSYFLPSVLGYSLPIYWRMTFFGAKGVLETSATSSGVTLFLEREKEPRLIPLVPAKPEAYLEAFLRDIQGQGYPDDLNTEAVLRVTRIALTIQQAAEQQLREVPLKF